MKLRVNHSENAFSLLEVMIALAIFFMCIFAILGVVTRGVSQARNLKPIEIDASSALAQLSLTNRLEEGPISDEIIKNFEAMYPGYTVGGDIYEVRSNGLFRIDFYVGGLTTTKKGAASKSSVLLFRPMSQQRGAFGRRR
jgi:Tfp pilus assembly protein PilV